MKENLHKILLSLILGVLPIFVNAYEFQVNNICYNRTSENTVEVTYYKFEDYDYNEHHNVSGTVVIPEKITYSGIEYSVTKIGDHAFHGCPKMTSITISSSIVTIENEVFTNCTGLTSIDIPSNVTSIGSNAFGGCTSLKNVNIADATTTLSFANSPAFPDSPLEKLYMGRICIGKPFNELKTLTSVEIGNAVTQIEPHEFSGCSGLTSVVIPNSVTSIGQYAFYQCVSLVSIDIPNSVKNIYQSAFKGCSQLVGFRIPDNVTAISESMFEGCESLKTIIIHDNVSTIGHAAFQSCSSIESITIPNTITSIGTNAFSYCSNLTSINLPDHLTKIGSGMFFRCKSLVSIKLPNQLTSIGGSAFYNCSALTSIDIPNSVTSIGRSAFSSTNLTTIAIPDGITSIEEYTFDHCASLTSVDFPSGLTSIDMCAFRGCTALERITIPDAVTSLGSYSFSDCANLKEVSIGKGVTIIGTGTFSKCSQMTEFVVPDNVITILSSAFQDCTNLGKVTIGSGVTSLDKAAFIGCNNLQAVNVSEENNSYSSQDGLLLSKDKSMLVFAPQGLTEVIIPDNIVSVENRAFYNSSSLTLVEIPSSVVSIRNEAFRGCKNLRTIKMSNGLSSIGEYAFNYCEKLEALEIPGSVTEIGNHAFYGCKSLANVVIASGKDTLKVGKNDIFALCPISTLYYGRNTISESENVLFCNSIKTIKSFTIGSCVTDISKPIISSGTRMNVVIEDGTDTLKLGEYALSGLPIETLYLGRNTKRKPSTGWAPQFGVSLRTVKTGNCVTYIESSAFMECYYLETVDISSSIDSIGGGAFRWCDNLKSINVAEDNQYFCSFNDALYDKKKTKLIQVPGTITSLIIPEGVETIGKGACYEIKKLVSVEMPKSVKYIEADAFSSCGNLVSLTSLAKHPPVCSRWALNGIYKEQCTLHIPRGTKALYQAADQWKDFLLVSEDAGLAESNEEVYKSAVDSIAKLRNTYELTIETIEKECHNVKDSEGIIASMKTIENTIETMSAAVETSFKALTLIDDVNTIFADYTATESAIAKLLTDAQTAQKAYEELVAANKAAYCEIMDSIAILKSKYDTVVVEIERKYATVVTNDTYNERKADIFENINNLEARVEKAYESNVLAGEKVTFVDKYKLIESAINDLLSFAIELNIYDVITNNTDSDIKVENGNIVIENAKGNISVYSLSGAMIQNVQANGESVRINMPAKEVYLIKTSKGAKKIAL